MEEMADAIRMRRFMVLRFPLLDTGIRRYDGLARIS